MSVNNVGKSKANIAQLKAGMEIKTIKADSKMESIFNAIDQNKNGVLEENELNKFKENIDKDGDAVATKKEAKKFIKENNLKEQKINKKDVIKFLQEYGENTENVENTEVLEDGKVSITYKDGSKKVVAQDRSYDTIENKDDKTITKSHSAEDVLQKEKTETADVTEIKTYAKDGKTVTNITEDNKTDKTFTDTTFDNNGNKIESTITSENDGSVSTIKYKDNKPESKEVIQGNSVSEYEYVDDKERITSKIQNKGNDAIEKRFEYQYNSDGSYTEEITQAGQQTHIINKCNSQGNRLEQIKTVNGTQHHISYDGEGNTTGIVVQNREDVTKLAQKFGCSVEDIQKINGKEKFEVGDIIKIPGEKEADMPELQNRKSPEEAKAEQKRDIAEAQRRAEIRAQKEAQLALETAQLKQIGMIDRKGAGTKVTGKLKGGKEVTLTKVGNAINNRQICKDKKGNYFVVAHDGVILKESYAKASTIYAGSEKVKGKIKDKSGNLTTKEFAVVPGVPKDKHGRRLVMDKMGNAYYMAHNGVILKGEYVEKSNRADAIKTDAKTAKAETLNMLEDQISNAQAAFDEQMKDDGWAGDAVDGLSVLWGSKNRASLVRKEMAYFKQDIAELKNCKTEAEFKTKFKQKFGIDYNSKAVADYMMNPSKSNYNKAFGTKRDIGTRVAEYNESQQTGADVLKTGLKVGAGIAIGVVTGGTGWVALGAAAAGTAIVSAAVEETDRANITGQYKDSEGKTVKTEGTFREGTDHMQILTDAALEGGAVLAGGAAGKAASALVKGVKTVDAAGKTVYVLNKTQKAARVGIAMAGDVGYGAAQDYVRNGEVTVTGVATNAAFSAVGSSISLGAGKYVKDKAQKTFAKIKDKGVKFKGSIEKAKTGVKIKTGKLTKGKIAELEPPKVKTPELEGGVPKKPQGAKTPELEGGAPKIPQGAKTPELEGGAPKKPQGAKTPEVEGGTPKKPQGAKTPEVEGGTPKKPQGAKTPEVEVGAPKKPQGAKTPEVEVGAPKIQKTGGSPTLETLLAKKFADKSLKIRFNDLNDAIKRIDDDTVKEHIEKELSGLISELYSTKKLNLAKLKEIEDLTDAMNTFNGHYSVYRQSNDIEGKSAMARFSKFAKDRKAKITDILEANTNTPVEIKKRVNGRLLKEDLARENRIYGIRQYVKNYPDSQMSDMLYEKYYLGMWESKSINPEAMKIATNKCREINKKFGVKIFMPSKLEMQNFHETTDFIEGEMSQWVQASKGKAKLPTVIDFSTGKNKWYDELAANGQGVSGGYSETLTGSLAFPKMDKQTVAHALRHELTHSNDLKLGTNIPDKYNLNEIMPKKQLIQNGKPVIRNGQPVMIPDFEHCKFKDEFRKIGISEVHIPYAYSNPKEFIAVASEGDLSKCSAEFKQMLIDFGMPEWRFNMGTAQAFESAQAQTISPILRGNNNTETNAINNIIGDENTSISYYTSQTSGSTTRITTPEPKTRIISPTTGEPPATSILGKIKLSMKKQILKNTKKEVRSELEKDDNEQKA